MEFTPITHRASPLRGIFIDTNVRVDRIERSLPLYFVNGLLDPEVYKYFACSARASLSPSALRTRSGAIKELIEACEFEEPAGSNKPWLAALPKLLLKARSDQSLQAVVTSGWEFLSHLVEEGRLAAEMLTNIAGVATSQAGKRPTAGYGGLLSHIVPSLPPPRSVVGAAPPKIVEDWRSPVRGPTSAFPQTLMLDFFCEGMRRDCAAASRRARSADERLAADYNLTGLLYHLQLGFACLRASEPLHQFVGDVSYDFEFGSGALVDIWHPVRGPAPPREDGSRRTRRDYLNEEFGLCPRNLATGDRRVGWKNLLLDETVPGVGMRARAHWLSPDVGHLYWRLHRAYLRCGRPLTSNHPFLFSSSSNRSIGTPWTLSSANDVFERGLRRLGRRPNASEGLTVHGFRHRGRLWMESVGILAETQQKVLHQQSIISQTSYGRTNRAETAEILRQAAFRLGYGPDPEASCRAAAGGMADEFLRIGRLIFEHFVEHYGDLV